MYREDEKEETFQEFVSSPNKATFEACVHACCQIYGFKKVQTPPLIETKFTSTTGLTSSAAELMLNTLIQGKIWFLMYINQLASVGDTRVECIADDENAWAIQVNFTAITLKCPSWALNDRIYHQMVYDCIQKLKKTKL